MHANCSCNISDADSSLGMESEKIFLTSQAVGGFLETNMASQIMFQGTRRPGSLADLEVFVLQYIKVASL